MNARPLSSLAAATVGAIGYGGSGPHIVYDAPNYETIGRAFTWLVLARRPQTDRQAVILSRGGLGGAVSLGLYLYFDATGTFYLYRTTGGPSYIQRAHPTNFSAELGWFWYVLSMADSGSAWFAATRPSDARQGKFTYAPFADNFGTGISAAESGTPFYQHNAPNSGTGANTSDSGVHMTTACTIVIPRALSAPAALAVMRDPWSALPFSDLWTDARGINRANPKDIASGRFMVDMRQASSDPSYSQPQRRTVLASPTRILRPTLDLAVRGWSAS